MDQIKALIQAMLVVIPIGAAARIVYCLVAINMDGDEEQSYRKRIRNALVFTAIAEAGIGGLLKWATSFFPSI